MFFLEIIQCLFRGCLLFELFDLHLMVVKLIAFWVAVFEYCLRWLVLMHGGLKSNANFYGRKPLGGADFLPLLESFFAAGFSFSSLCYAKGTKV
jgi:hypothetical protein